MKNCHSSVAIAWPRGRHVVGVGHKVFFVLASSFASSDYRSGSSVAVSYITNGSDLSFF